MTTARERARAELTQEIKDLARGHLAQHGAAGLSLRAVARDLGMVSSAVYRYFPSRDDLLTALLLDAYDAVGGAAEAAERSVRRGDVLGRWLAATRAVREWAAARPQEWALLFGSPVPGYAAPRDTVGPAARVPLLLLSVVADGTGEPAPLPPLPKQVRADLAALGDQVGELPEPLLARAVMAWTHLVGCISFELFGHLVGSVTDYPAWFDLQMRALAASVGVART